MLLPAAAASPAFAVIQQTINYQGFLLSKITNLPMETPTDIKFVIHSVPTGDAPLFTENRCNVGMNKGRYDVEIGSVAGGIPASVFLTSQNLWLEIQVDGDGDCSGSYEAMSPRVRLQASPFAFNSLYASTASAATTVFAADTIGALAQTTNGAITISTNLFVQGGISVGSISPGQKLAVAGLVESSTGGFKFPDGSVQIKAAAITMWDVSGDNIYTINPGNVGIGENLTSPLARLHISSAPGEAGDLLLVSTGTSPLFLVNGLGEVHAGSYYGDGRTLSGILSASGGTMNGPLILASSMTASGALTLAGSSLTVTSPLGLSSPKLRLAANVELSSAPALAKGGIMVSTHIYLSGSAKFYGDAGGLYNVNSTDSTKVRLTGDTMSGSLQTTTLTVTGSAFSVGDSTFTVSYGNVAVGSPSYLALFTVGGDIFAASSITTQSGLSADNIVSTSANFWAGITASTGTFMGYTGPDDANSYSINTASGIKVNLGAVVAPSFIGDGSQLTSVVGTDSNRVLKSGDIMTGNLQVLGSSLTVAYGDTAWYALTVASAVSVDAYALAVTTDGNVGVQISNPSAPLEVNSQVLVSNTGGPSELHLKSYAGYSYLRWSDSSLVTNGPNQGALGYPLLTRDLVYRAMGSDPSTGGAEVFRVKSDNSANWLFGIGTNAPQEKFHVASNLLVGISASSPILYISTAAGGVSISTTTQTHALTVNGGINAVSSITAQGGFYGNGSGLTMPQELVIGSITAIAGGAYDGVVFSTTIYASSRLAVGTDDLGAPFNPQSDLHIRGTTRLDQKGSEAVVLYFNPNFSGDSYIRWDNDFLAQYANKGVLGIKANSKDLIYRGGASSLDNGVEAFRIKPDGNFAIGTAQTRLDVNGTAAFGSSLTVTGTGLSGTQTALAVIGSTLVVRNDGSVGIGTPTPQARLDVNGGAQFGSGATKSAFTSEGFWVPRAMTTAELQAAGGTPPVVGAVVFNSSIANICFSTGTAVGQWALAGTKADCY